MSNRMKCDKCGSTDIRFTDENGHQWYFGFTVVVGLSSEARKSIVEHMMKCAIEEFEKLEAGGIPE